MTAGSALALYWSVLLVVVIAVRREVGGAGGATSRPVDVRLYLALVVAVLTTVVLTVLRLRSGA